MIRSTPRLLLLALISLTLISSGCVERKLTVTSDPPNALVYLNGKEAGRTPIEQDFLWYGNYDVQVRAPGYDTLKTQSKVTAPWWQWVPIDLLAEFMPWHPTDRQTLHYTLTPAAPIDTPAEVLIDRATEMKGKVESSAVR